MNEPGPRPGFGCIDLKAQLRQVLVPLDQTISSLPVHGYLPKDNDRPRPAAVLVGITAGEPSVLLTLRSTRLARHAGQVAFPGGVRDAQDDSVVHTALREAHEEAGIDPGGVEPIGYLSRYDTITGYRMTAVVGLLAADVQPAPDRVEVESVFSVPLSDVVDADAYQVDHIRFSGRRFEVLTLKHPEHRIWGATAALLFDLGHRLRDKAEDFSRVSAE